MGRGHDEMDPSDTEADSDAEPAGSGPTGEGDPMTVGSFHRCRSLCDGAGLCSLGKWPPWSRPEAVAPRLLRFRHIVQEGVTRWCSHMGKSPAALFDMLAEGAVKDDPIPSALMSDLIEQAVDLYAGYVVKARRQAGDAPQHVEIRLMQALLHEAGDPDSNGMRHYVHGVRLGVNHRLPRTPAVFERTRTWRLPEQATADKYYGTDTIGVWRDNYKSVQGYLHLIEAQLADHAARGLASR